MCRCEREKRMFECLCCAKIFFSEANYDRMMCGIIFDKVCSKFCEKIILLARDKNFLKEHEAQLTVVSNRINENALSTKKT